MFCHCSGGGGAQRLAVHFQWESPGFHPAAPVAQWIRHWPPKPGIMGSSPIWGDWQQSGAAEACWAHNPEVDGSKPSSANTVLTYKSTLPREHISVGPGCLPSDVSVVGCWRAAIRTQRSSGENGLHLWYLQCAEFKALLGRALNRAEHGALLALLPMTLCRLYLVTFHHCLFLSLFN